MKALRWYDSRDVRVEDAPAPRIQDPKDAILRITSSTICGSDLHLYNGFVMTLEKGDILGHEFMGEVMEVGPAVKNLEAGDRVVAAFPISCGECETCSAASRAARPSSCAFPTPTWAPSRFPPHIPDEKALFLSDIVPTGWQAAVNCDLKGGETVAVWGAERVIAIDHVPERLALAKAAGAETLNFDEIEVHEELMERTHGHGPDACIDAVGLESHEGHFIGLYDKIKQVMRAESDRPFALRQAIMACRKGGSLSVIGAYSGLADKIPLRALFNKGLTVRLCQAHVQAFWKDLLGMIESGKLDPSVVVTHRMPLEQAAEGYKLFLQKKEGVQKIVLKP